MVYYSRLPHHTPTQSGHLQEEIMPVCIVVMCHIPTDVAIVGGTDIFELCQKALGDDFPVSEVGEPYEDGLPRANFVIAAVPVREGDDPTEIQGRLVNYEPLQSAFENIGDGVTGPVIAQLVF